MNILFLGSTGVHQALLAACLHLDPRLDRDYKTLPYFNDYQLESGGHPLYIGSDQRNRRVHCLGVGSDVQMVNKTLRQLRIILDSSPEEMEIIPIVIKSQRLIAWLHQLAQIGWLKPLSSNLIACILQLEYENIRQQIPGLTKSDSLYRSKTME